MNLYQRKSNRLVSNFQTNHSSIAASSKYTPLKSFSPLLLTTLWHGEPCKDLCGWCGTVECDWERYGNELRESGVRLHRKLATRCHRNQVVRFSLCRLYVYMKTGRMGGDVPFCVRRKLEEQGPRQRKGKRAQLCSCR
jgi:hypothetical protein